MSAESAVQPPKEIARANQHDIKIIWQDDHESIYPARELRLRCPCAGCIDEFTGHVRLIAASVPQDVHPVAVRLVGAYAMHVRWSDGHDTGIFAFERLRKLCPCGRHEVATPRG